MKKKYKNLIEDLKNLKKIDAPFGIEQKIWNKINSSDKTEIKSVWSKLSVRMVPAVAVLATAVLLFVVIENNAYEYQDPFSVEPEQRQDLIEFSTQEQNLIERDELPETKSVQPEKSREEKPSVVFRKKETPAPEALSMENQLAGRDQVLSDEDSALPVANEVLSSAARKELDRKDQMLAPEATMKQGLNFRQIHLSEQEKQEVNELKSRVLQENRTKSE